MVGDKKKILIIDDDGFLLDMYALKFSQNNFDVSTFTEGALALEKLRGGLRPDVILLDLTMPVMDGFEVLEKINADGLSENSTKIILSNKSQEEDMVRATGLGIAGYIVKANSTPTEVIAQVEKILASRGTLSK